jgi:hypothetical protein
MSSLRPPKRPPPAAPPRPATAYVSRKPRAIVDQEGELWFSEISRVRVLVRNLSRGGACIEGAPPLRPRMRIALSIRLPEQGGLLYLVGRVVWTTRRATGVRFWGSKQLPSPMPWPEVEPEGTR